MYTKHEGWGWLRHVAVSILYFASSTALLHMSFHFWQLSAGLRLACLLLMPYRYWPAMAFGEMLSMGKISYDCYNEFGPVYAFVYLMPRSVIAMPIVHWCRQRLALFGPKRQIRMGVLICCFFSVSLLIATFNHFLAWAALTWFASVTPSQPGATFDWLPRYFLGQYLGVLTVVPVVLMGWQMAREKSWPSWWARLSTSRLAMESVAILLPSLALLMWAAAHYAHNELGQMARMAMFLPVAALAMRHGWRGAALGGCLASIALIVVMPTPPHDPMALQQAEAMTWQAEMFIAAITTLLMLGARIAVLNEREEKERIDGRLVLQAAQQGIYLSELRMQRVAETIDQIGLSIQDTHERLLGQLRRFMPNFKESGLIKQTLVSRQQVFRLSETIYPRACLDQGLSFALCQGTIARAFEANDIAYRCVITGMDLATFTAGVQLALYRATCEAALEIYQRTDLSAVHLRIRAGRYQGRRGVVLSMKGERTSASSGLMPSPFECGQFRDRLGATGEGTHALYDHALIYGGTVRIVAMTYGTQLTLLLLDGETRPGPMN